MSERVKIYTYSYWLSKNSHRFRKHGMPNVIFNRSDMTWSTESNKPTFNYICVIIHSPIISKIETRFNKLYENE